MTNWPEIHLCEARGAWWRRKFEYRHHMLLDYLAKVQNNKKHYPSHHEALKAAEAGVAKWGKLEGAAAREVHKYAKRVAELRPKPVGPQGEGYSTPKTSWNPYRRPIANWIIREIYSAVNSHGAHGVVTSGLRTYQKQKELYELYLRGGNVAAPPGHSNHEGYVYNSAKSGAVDWEPAESLNNALVHKPSHKLLWAETHGLADHPHFSKNGH